MQLRWSSTVKIASADLPALTFGRSKGLGFDRVIIYPTKEMMDWLKNAQSALKAETRAKLYVGLTRARHAVAVVYDPTDGEAITGFTVFE
ncbi:ATP-binding domain-containing protein [Rhizobium leguminosarum]|uniref:ATP-binding domain-containing protein n=1 Tax=Rhizobium leguminosarum TaxID=384 RepID=UPI0028F40416|nr:3'-5' exonuclease [Rhizobium leguminosarum]